METKVILKFVGFMVLRFVKDGCRKKFQSKYVIVKKKLMNELV